MSTELAPNPAVAAQEAKHYESLYGGLDGIEAQLSPENRDQLQAFTATEEDPQEMKARMVNMAYIKAKNPQIDEDALAGNWEQAKTAYAKQVLGLDKPEVTDKELYAGIAGKMQSARDERGLIAEGMGHLFDSFRAGTSNQRQAFTATLAEMRGKPGYDPARLDVYTHLAQEQWKAWEGTGQHFPAAVDAVGSYFKAYTGNTAPEAEQLAARQAALRALDSVPREQQDAILGLAMRQKGETADAGGLESMAGRLDAGISKFGESAGNALRDLVVGMQPTGPLAVLDQQEGRKTARKLDSALDGSLDPYHGSNAFSEGVLGAAEGLPRMLAMFHPAGVAANVGAFAEEARGHFEDAGIDPVKANGLGLAAAIPLTALQMVTSKTVLRGNLSGAAEAWMLRNVSGKTGAALAKGYAKNLLAQGAENTALLATVTAGQQLTEPAVQQLGHVLDGTIPGVDWKGELARLKNAAPETLASLVPLIALGVGAGTLRTRGAALDARFVQDRPALEAIGLKPEAVDAVLAAKTPDDAVNVLQANFGEREAVTIQQPELPGSGLKKETTTLGDLIGQQVRYEGYSGKLIRDEEGNFVLLKETTQKGAIDRFEVADTGKDPLTVANGIGVVPELGWHSAAREVTIPGSKITLAPEGGYNVHDAEGNMVGQSATPEMAAKLALEPATGPADVSPPDQSLGVAANGRLGQALSEGMAQVRQIAREVSDLPQFKGFKEVLNRWVGDNQLGLMHTAADVRQVVAALPDMATRKAIGRWLDAGGDTKALEHHLRETTKNEAKTEYANALKLTPEQVKVAEGIQAWFKQRFDRAVAAGVLEEARFREGYLTHLIEKPFVQGGPGSKFNQELNKNFKFSKERTFPNLYELEKADFSVKTTDVAEIMARYDANLNRAILSRQLVKDLLEAKTEGGEALAVPLKGQIRPAEGEGEKGVNFINNPRQAVVDKAAAAVEKLTKELQDLHDQFSATESVVERFDLAKDIKDLREEIATLKAEQSSEDAVTYKSIDHPALRKWSWIGKDPTGTDTFMQGDIGVHPDIKTHLENALGRSGLRNWYDEKGNALSSIPKAVVKALDVSNSFLKANLLGGVSLFHAVHEYKRALGNRVAVKPWDLPEIDPENARVKMQVRTGLMLTNAHEVENAYSEGLGGRSLVDKIPGLGKLSAGIGEYTFSKLIPSLKSEVWNHVFDRNLKTFADAISKGDATKEQVAYLTSHQINARFGHQNYADLGRNPTFQHLLQITTLAPDFWESNLRNYAQTLQGVAGAKVGREAALAFATTAAVLWTVSRVMNKALDDDYHFDHPFAVVANGRTYTMRNEVEDLWRMWGNSRQYIMGRISPSSTAGLEALTGRNWRGEKITGFEVFKDWVSKVFPMSLRFLPGVKDATDKLETGGGRTVSVWQQFLGSIGVQVSRNSPLADAYQLANDYKKKTGDLEDRGTYPVSKYQQLRYALEDKDQNKAIEEIVKLRKAGEPIFKLTRGFHSSLFNSWTGSKAKDEEFKASLSPEDRAKVEKAEAHRQAVFDAYTKLVSTQP